MNTPRHPHLSPVRSLVVKLGTQLLSDKQGNLDTPFLSRIASQVAALRQRGLRVTIVSSGAIGCGLRELKLPKRPTDLPKLQAVAAVGQRRLMDAWAGAFENHDLKVAQLLLTREDIEHRTRFLNLRNTIHAAQEMGAVPIINENDTISTDEIIKITFGDNDILAAMVSAALRAQLLILLSVVDGVLDERGKPIRLVSAIEHARGMVRTEKSPLGKGGMNSKVEAARMVTEAGECLVVADGRMPDVLLRVLDSDEVGTLFVPPGKKLSSRSRWIGSVRPVGHVSVDEGAARAVADKQKSLLPAGIQSVQGEFERGDVIGITDPDGKLIARGLTNYASADITKIAGKKSAEVRNLLKDAAYDEVVHRDNMVLW
ncbi:MAG TPA: glutamate 5-kinase [Tepidisphaeraceae bacterium]|jgi:glutamate 5-kinase|nr:glutamate 5-kinase [Tepidisphaeraceae bacterium]